jgi:hypothetical protein
MPRSSPVPTYSLDFPDYEFREYPKVKFHPQMEPVTVNDDYEEAELGTEWTDKPTFPKMRYSKVKGKRRVMSADEEASITPEAEGWRDMPFVSPRLVGNRPGPINADTDAEYAAFRAWRAEQRRREAAEAGAQFSEPKTAPVTALAPEAPLAVEDPVDEAERETLIGEAHINGVHIDKRWSTAKIRAAVQKGGTVE